MTVWYCNIEAVEDGYHFIFDYQCYETERNNSNTILKNILEMALTSESKPQEVDKRLHILSS